jgi:hypothetical protein
MPALLLVALSVCCASLSAQVPHGYLVVAEETVSGRGRVCLVDPWTGVETELRAMDGAPMEVAGLAVDPSDPTHLHMLRDGFAPGIAVLQGSRVLQVEFDTIADGSPVRLQVVGDQLLAPVPDGDSPGLWSVSAGASPELLWSLPGARDLAVYDGKAYVSSFVQGTSSRIDEVDLITGTVRSLGSAYPPILSLGNFVGRRLLAGTASGELLSIDRFTGQPSSLGNPRLGAITAIAVDPVSGLPYFGTDRGEVYLFGSFTEPVHRAGGTIRDLDVGVHDLGSWLFYGNGCAGSGSVAPQFAYVDRPVRGGSLTVAMSGGPAGAGAVLVAGSSREMFRDGRSLPFPLKELVAGVDSGCMVYTDAQASQFATLDATGRAQVVVFVPDLPSLIGLHTTWQWAVLDPDAPGGLISSHGAEAIVR